MDYLIYYRYCAT